MLQMVEIITRWARYRTLTWDPSPAKTLSLVAAALPTRVITPTCGFGSTSHECRNNRLGESTDLRFVSQLQPEGSAYYEEGGGSHPRSIPGMDSRHVTSMQMWLQLFLNVFLTTIGGKLFKLGEEMIVT